MGNGLTLTGRLKKAASKFHDRIAISACGRFGLTHARLQEHVDHAAALLIASGVNVGDIVALAFPNTIEFVILFLAVIRCRATAAPLNPAYTAKEFQFYLSDSEPCLLLTPQGGNKPAQSAASKLNIPHLTAVLLSADSKITLSSTDIEPNLKLVSKVVNDPSDIALYLYDSGILGFSKGVRFTQKQLAIVVQFNECNYRQFDSTVIEYPLFHYHHLVIELLSYLAAGTAVALPVAARSSASRFSADMISDNATHHTVDNVARVCYRSKVACPCQSNDTPEGKNAPKTTEENKTETERGGGEGGCCAKLIEEFEKLSGPKKFSYEAHDRIMGGGGFGNNVACVRSKVAGPYRSNDMPKGKNAPKTIEENKTETERGGEEGGPCAKLTKEFEKLRGPKKFSYEAHDRIMGGGGFGDNVASVRSKVAGPYRSNDMPEGKNAPKTTEENKTETERGGGEGGPCAKLTEEFEKLSGPKKFSYEAHDRIMGEGGFGDNVACGRSKVGRPYQSNGMPRGKNAPKTTKEKKTETGRGGEEGGHCAKLTKEFEKLTGPKLFPYEELMIVAANGKILGEGGFGVVYKGHIGDAHTPVAMKMIKSHSARGIKEYKSEVMTLSQLRHKNLVQLLGYCHEMNKFILVYEFIGGRSLDYHLFQRRTRLTWERRYNIALGLASALHYLHKQCRQYVIHRDIKSSNIMLDEEFEAKLGDFGMAKLVDHTRDPSTTQVKGTLGYLAPEYFRTGKASKESDIYSFGVVLLEILCGKRVSNSMLAEQGGLVRWVWKRSGCRSWWGRWFWNLHLPVDERLGKVFDKKQAEALMIVGLWCAHPIARSRPSIEEAMAVLNLTLEPRKLSSKVSSFNI